MKTVLIFITLICIAAPSLHANETAPALKPQIVIESKFIELPDAMADSLNFSGNHSFMDKYPGKPMPPTSHLRAVLFEKQAEELLSTLSAQKDVNLWSNPRVTTSSGNRAVVERVRELRHPTEWNQPDEKEKSWIPKTFETTNIGTTLDVGPNLTEDGLIDLKAEPSVVEFLGFTDFETKKPRFIVKADLTKPLTERTLGLEGYENSEGRPMKAVFSTRKTNVDVRIYPGQTVVLDLLGEHEPIAPFPPVRPGYRIIVLIRASLMNLEESATAPKQEASPPQVVEKQPASDLPIGTAVEGKQGFVISPHSPTSGAIDVRGYPSGTEVKDPYSGKMFQIP